MMRHSGLQLDVLCLYRALLRAAKKKDPKKSTGFISFVQQEFREKARSIGKNDFKTIEHSLRHGYKQIKLIQMPGFSTATFAKKGES